MRLINEIIVLCGLSREQGRRLPWQCSWQQAEHQAGKLQTFCPNLLPPAAGTSVCPFPLPCPLLCKGGSFPGAGTSGSDQEH